MDIDIPPPYVCFVACVKNKLVILIRQDRQVSNFSISGYLPEIWSMTLSMVFANIIAVRGCTCVCLRCFFVNYSWQIEYIKATPMEKEITVVLGKNKELFEK